MVKHRTMEFHRYTFRLSPEIVQALNQNGIAKRWGTSYAVREILGKGLRIPPEGRHGAVRRSRRAKARE